MNTISIRGRTYYCHPIYDKYAVNGFSPIIDVVGKKITLE